MASPSPPPENGVIDIFPIFFLMRRFGARFSAHGTYFDGEWMSGERDLRACLLFQRESRLEEFSGSYCRFLR